MILFLISTLLWLPVGFTLIKILVDGWFCFLGFHMWTQEGDGCDIDMVTNDITPAYYTRTCGVCHKEQNVKPGSRKWNKHWKMKRESMKSPEWIQYRAAWLLDADHEVDILTGEPTSATLRPAAQRNPAHL